MLQLVAVTTLVIVVAGLTIYLFYAVIHPERF